MRKSTRQGFDAKSIQLKSLLQLQNISAFTYRYLQLCVVLCFFAFSHKTRCLFSSFSVPKASSHFPRHCACTALVLCPVRQHCLLSGNDCESPFCSYQRSPSLSREENLPCPAETAMPPAFIWTHPLNPRDIKGFPHVMEASWPVPKQNNAFPIFWELCSKCACLPG